jgi:hypothetical protein
MAVKKGKSVADATVQRLNVRIDPAAYQRLMIHAVMAKRSPGELVAELINSNLRDWRVQSNRGQSNGSVETTAGVESSEASVAA